MIIKAKPEAKFKIICEMTARDNNLLNIEWLCEIAGVSRSGYYRWINAKPVRDARDEQDAADFTLIQKAYRYRGYDKGARGMCNPLNVPSWKLLERLGMQREGHLRQNIYFKNDANGSPLWSDTFVYAILAMEWVNLFD